MIFEQGYLCVLAVELVAIAVNYMMSRGSSDYVVLTLTAA